MRTIRFSHRYEKMPIEIKTAVLLGVEAWDVEKLPASFKDYDAEYEGEGATLYYHLPEKGKVIVLFLWGEHTLFTTIRRWSPSKEKYYRDLVGCDFLIDLAIGQGLKGCKKIER